MPECEACRRPIFYDEGTDTWQHITPEDSNACGPEEQARATGREGIYPLEGSA